MHLQTPLFAAALIFATPALCFKPISGPYASDNPRFLIHTTFNSFNDREMVSWSAGGGSGATISNDSSHPFAWRAIGNGTRADIRGTRAFGSGYPYGATNYSTIAGRPFPFGSWPLYWPNNLMGSDEYGPELDLIRPGGQLVVTPVTSDISYWNLTETYYTIGDRDSSVAMMNSLVTWCDALPAWPALFNPSANTTSSTTTPNIQVQNVIQYYRASSFALAYTNYTNAFALNATAEGTESTSLPDIVLASSFRICIDGVIANALPILDACNSCYDANDPGGSNVKDTLDWMDWGFFLIVPFGVIIVIGICTGICHILDLIFGFSRRAQGRQALLRRAGALWYEDYP
jgi:hypothetical protein